MSIFQLSKMVDRKHPHMNAIKYILSFIWVWAYAYSLLSLFYILELRLLLHQIPYFMQSRPLYVPYAHARSFIFIEKSVRSYTTKDTVYLIHIESNMGAFASELLLLSEVLPKYLPLINFNAYYLHLHLLQCRRYEDFISFLYYYTFMTELWILLNEVC